MGKAWMELNAHSDRKFVSLLMRWILWQGIVRQEMLPSRAMSSEQASGTEHGAA